MVRPQFSSSDPEGETGPEAGNLAVWGGELGRGPAIGEGDPGRRDAPAETLEKAGAELAFGDLFDFHDIRKAMVGVQRAYHVPPFAPNLLEVAMLFALAAEEAKLEVVALMSQWHPHPTDPSIVSREHWIANQIYRWMPSVDVVHINPGLFPFPVAARNKISQTYI